jgi:hypothetical protein
VVARLAHTQEVGSSNLSPATNMRPHYETEIDRLGEEQLRQKLEQAIGGSFYKLNPPAYRVDWFHTVNGKGVAFVEAKRRNRTFTQYPDVVLSAHKYADGVNLAEGTGLSFCLVVEFTDCIAIAFLEKSLKLPTSYGGRTSKTRDAGDIEPVVHIPMSCFTKVPLRHS